jgi:hypothetical protein
MKNSFIALIVIITIAVSANCQSIKVPAVVKAAFAAKYPAATNVKRGKENAKEYEADIKVINKKMEVILTPERQFTK